MRPRTPTLLALLLLPACAAEVPPPAPPPPPPPPPPPVVIAPPPPPVYKGMDRAELNRNAVRANLPVYWVDDANHDGIVDPGEVVPLLFYPTQGHWVQDGAFTAEFDRAWQAIKTAGTLATATPPTPEDQRRALVAQDLDQGLPTLVASDFASASHEDKALVTHMLNVARMIDELYAVQSGLPALAPLLAAGDDLSRSLFRRNWGPGCAAPLTEKNPQCTAIPGAPRPLVDVYPADLQKDPGFCAALEKLPGSKALLDHFVAVRKDAAGKLVPVPFSEAYKAPMMAIAHELQDASDDVADPAEAPLKAYLSAAARSFVTGDWNPADEAWAKMTVKNSKWYVRVGPDEAYWEPCSLKAGFHLTFARINRESLAWQAKLDPFEQEMEQNVAKRIGGVYKARKVTFHLPDFIDIVLNAGNDREPLGGTIGESLPNWGPIAAAGRGRTVAMSNVFTDTDSVSIRHKQAESLLSKETMASYVDSPAPGLLDTILHEATHNLGPTDEYRWAGKTGEQAFGGQLAAMLEERQGPDRRALLHRLRGPEGAAHARGGASVVREQLRLGARPHLARDVHRHARTQAVQPARRHPGRPAARRRGGDLRPERAGGRRERRRVRHPLRQDAGRNREDDAGRWPAQGQERQAGSQRARGQVRRRSPRAAEARGRARASSTRGRVWCTPCGCRSDRAPSPSHGQRDHPDREPPPRASGFLGPGHPAAAADGTLHVESRVGAQ